MTVQGFDPARLARIGAHFAAYVDDGRLPGWQLQVSRRGEVVYRAQHGWRDVEARQPVEDDTVFRIYSMTKPITSVAAMMLYEEGHFELSDPIARFIPAFADMQVLEGGTALKPVTRPAAGPIRVQHLLNHTSGLTYGFHHIHVQDEMYRNAGYEWGVPKGKTLEQAVADWARLPLRFDPGTRWNYSVATDVLGRLVEVVSGQSLDRFFQQRIFDPLGMKDSSFTVRGDLGERLGALYIPNAEGKATRNDDFSNAARGEITFLSGGGGLLSTTADYHRFTQMLLRGGELDGARLLGSRTLRAMTRNTLPGGQDLVQFGIPLFAEVKYDGQGFGLGFSVVQDPVAAGTLGSVGEFAWGGAASTAFWVDPAEQITAIFMTQLLPSSTWPLRTQLRQMVYAALVD
ncbi:MAG: beta-lactamase family protein [Burkholderiales bacterium]|nr:beta-lactamase family protein [Burkholderiales bacterium]